MNILANDEYESAKRKGMKEFNKYRSMNKNPYLKNLDSILSRGHILSEVSLGLMDIPLDRVVGTKTSGRSKSFARNFMPILKPSTEFASKWISLYDSHIKEGIRDAIKVYEYLNKYYVQEGNKRVSVLKHFNAFSVLGNVIRLIPRYDPNNQEIVIYYEFLDFYEKTGINFLWMTKKNNFKKLYAFIQKFNWLDEGISEFNIIFNQFKKNYIELGGEKNNCSVGDAFIRYLEIFSYTKHIGNEEFKKQISDIWNEISLLSSEEIHPEYTADSLTKKGLLESLVSIPPSKVNIAFINAKNPQISAWTLGHDIGINHIKNIFGDKIEVEIFNNIIEDEQAYNKIFDIANKGFDVIFTTSPAYLNSTLKTSLSFKKTKFLSCSESLISKNVRTYFGRIYEPNFLVGMIAGSMTKSNNLGYVVTFPIPEVISSINAYCLGAKFVNPDAKVYVKWVENTSNKNTNTYTIDKQLKEHGIDIISHQESSDIHTKLLDSGIYFVDSDNKKIEHDYLAAPVWNWGEFYEQIIHSILNGSYTKISNFLNHSDKAISYWWGLESKVVDVFYSESKLPYSVIKSMNFMKKMIKEGHFNPFSGVIFDNKGIKRVEENQTLSASEILKMDWFVEGVIGSIPAIKTKDLDNTMLELFSVKKDYN